VRRRAMDRRKATALLVAFLCSLLLASVALANGTPAIDWYVIGGGGGHVEAGVYALDGTIGQAVVGTATDTGYELCSGFWCGAVVEYRIYLPIVLKNYS
jgi:hypothetical protein